MLQSITEALQTAGYIPIHTQGTCNANEQNQVINL